MTYNCLTNLWSYATVTDDKKRHLSRKKPSADTNDQEEEEGAISKKVNSHKNSRDL